MIQSMKRLFTRYLLSILAFGCTAIGSVAEDASGSWKWSFTTQNGDTIESTAKLKQEGQKLSGSVTSRFGEAEISDGSVKGEEVFFSIKRERDGQAFVIKYTGKLTGDKITGQMHFERDGQSRSREWEARRAPGKASIAGNWTTALILPDGNRIEGSLRVKQDGDKLTGALIRNENETALQEGKIAGDEISFKVLRDRDGRTVTAKYRGKVSGDSIKGKVESDWSGDWQTLDWEGSRAK